MGKRSLRKAPRSGDAPSPELPEEKRSRSRTRFGSVCLRVLANIALFAAALFPAWLTAQMIADSAVNTPYGDDWKLVDQLENLHLAQFEWGDLWRPVDGERIPLPQFLHLTALRCTGGDVRADAWMNFTWISLTSLGLLLLLLRTIGGGPGAATLFFIANLALFSPGQDLFAMRQAAMLLPVACLVWATLIASFPGSTVLKFAACAFVTATALGSGIYGLSLLLTVPMLAAFAVGLPCRIRPWLIAGGWFLFALLALQLYFKDLNSTLTPSAGVEPIPLLEQAFSLAFQVLSSPLADARSISSAVRTGLGATLATALLSLTAWTLLTTITRRQPWSGGRRAPWLLLGIGGLLGIGLASATRVTAAVPFMSAGGNLSIPGHAAIPVLMGSLVPLFLQSRERAEPVPRKLLSVLLTGLFLAVIAAQSSTWLQGTTTIRNQYQDRLRSRAALHLCKVFPVDDAVSFGTGDPALILRRAQFLHNEGYLTPLLLNEPFWPDRRIATRRLSILEARVTLQPDAAGETAYRVAARLPSSRPEHFDLPAGVLLASQDPSDPTRHRLLAIGRLDPSDPSAWIFERPRDHLPGTSLEFWALDGHQLLAHRLSQILTPEGELLQRSAEPTSPP
jgi:hypothetical protein